MVPFPMLPTESSAERRLYEGFLAQLSDEYIVFHSVPWNLKPRRRGGPRLEGEADFVIGHAVLGILVIEAKGGELRYDPTTKTWIQAGRTGTHVMDEDPFEQAKNEMHSLLDILSGYPGWDRWRPSYGYGVAFPDGLYKTGAHPGAPPELAIDRDDMQALALRVEQIMGRWQHRGRRFGAEGIEALQRALGVKVEIRAPLNFLFGEEKRQIIELTDDQMFALTYVMHRRRAAIVGPAGSGKTVLAIQLAKRLAEGGSDTLLTCFNWRLGAHLKDVAGRTPHLDVLHFHELCRRMAQEAGLDVSPAPEDERHQASYYEKDLPALLSQAADVLGARYDAIVVDEAQDFLPEWWPTLMRLHRKPDDGYFFVFSDSNQNLYGGRLPSDMVDVEVPLLQNVRNTKRIHEFVTAHFGGDFPPAAKGPPGRPVDVFGYRDQDELVHLLTVVLKNLREEDVPLDDIVVLTPSRAANSELRKRSDVDGFRLSDVPEPDAVWVCTIHGFKGLERPVVILAELGERHREDLEKYLYIGGSRARNQLIVLATEPTAKELRRLAGVSQA
jgi:UvrD-like helicase C-terminal domain/Nuclease-related domain/AAA domain